MLPYLVLGVIVAVAYSQIREGLFTAFTMLINVILAGVISFMFWEPLADHLEPYFQDKFFEGTEDLVALILTFAVSLIALRYVTNTLAKDIIEFPGNFQLCGGIVGLLTGYLVAGFLVVALETMPWHENFLDFQPRSDKENPLRSIFPPDRVWLAMMRHAGAYPFANQERDPSAANRYDRFRTFDRAGSFELRYFRYRRWGDQRPPVPYRGEFNAELGN